jgi:hypothetical protein
MTGECLAWIVTNINTALTTGLLAGTFALLVTAAIIVC